MGSSGICQQIFNEDRTKLRTDREADIGNRIWHTTISQLRIWQTLHSGIRPQTPATHFYEANRKCTSTNPEIQAQTPNTICL